jgi:hypothetical protein
MAGMDYLWIRLFAGQEKTGPLNNVRTGARDQAEEREPYD